MAGIYLIAIALARKLGLAGMIGATLFASTQLLAATSTTAEHPASLNKAPEASGQAQARLASTGKPLSQQLNKPLWAELSLAQRQVLTPLGNEWHKLDAVRKKKWLEIANKYPKMQPEEQQRIQARMRDWAALTPEQRRIARDSYARAKKLDADQKSAKWQQYQNLSDEEKNKLAADTKKKKNVANLPRAVANRSKPAKAVNSVPAAVIPSPPAESAGNSAAPVAAAPALTQPEPAIGPPSYIIK